MKRLTFAICLLLMAWSVYPQDIDLESFTERLFQVQDEAIDYEDLYESLLLYYTNKLNLNKATPEALGSLYILSPQQLSGFFSYRDQFGNLLSIYELQAIPGFDLETIRSLLPFVSIEESETDGRPLLTRIVAEENNYLLLRFTQRLEEQVGYTPALPVDTTFSRDEAGNIIDTLLNAPNRYQGSPQKLYGRYRVSKKGDFSLGFTFEKDAGETLGFTPKTNGFDFYSYHLLLENKAGFDKMLIGDYQLQVGQGLVFGAGFSAGKGAETVNTIKRNNLGLQPYTSVLESGFFRGIGLSKEINDLSVTAFYSFLKQDGNIQERADFSEFEQFINAIQNTGLHRTITELNNKDVIQEQSIGGVVQWNPDRTFSLGLSTSLTTYSNPIQRTPTNYNQFEFSGKQNHVSSLNFSYSWQNFILFGESARSGSGGIGANGGVVASLTPNIDFAIMLRSYDKNFHSFYGNGFGESSRIINERGTYWGLSFHPPGKHKVNVYYDRFRFPWLRFGTEAPSDGYEYLGRYTYKPSRQVSLYAQGRAQRKQVTLPEGNLNILRDQVRINYLFNIDYELKPWLKLKTKVQSSNQKEGDAFTKGFALIQDVHLNVWELKFSTRTALFDTDDFDNAQYVFENDVLYSFSIPAYNGTGVRNYIMVRYDPLSTLSLWIRYAQYRFRTAGETTVGSGLEQSTGSVSSEIKVMARIKF